MVTHQVAKQIVVPLKNGTNASGWYGIYCGRHYISVSASLKPPYLVYGENVEDCLEKMKRLIG